LPAQDDQQFVAAVVEVVDVFRLARLELPDRAAEATPSADKASRSRTTPVGNLVPDVGRVRDAPILKRRACMFHLG
jgi:hypothetical protein